MRDIIFRGKRVDNGEWVEGFVYEHQPPLQGIVPENYVPENSKWYICNTAFADWNIPRQVEFVEVDPSTVGQFTGLTDKNGKKIFEGDIVRHGYTITYSNGKTSDFYNNMPISFSNHYGGWIVGVQGILTFKTIQKYSIEVIGTIYDE